MNAPKPDGPGKLIGGYATNNLSDQEKQQLFEAALEDQHLFNALMEDESLRHLLEQPGVRDELIGALAPQLTIWQRTWKWIGTPIAWGSIGAVATAAVVLVVVTRTLPERQAAVQMAQSERQPPLVATPAPMVQSPPPIAESRPQRVSERVSSDSSQAEAGAARQRLDLPQMPPAITAPAPAVDMVRERFAAKDVKERDLRDKKELELAKSPQSQPQAQTPAPMAQQQAQQQGQQGAITSAQVEAERRNTSVQAVNVVPAPAFRAEPTAKPQPPVTLAFDYTVLSNGVEIVPAADGFAALIARNASGSYSTVVSSTRARKGSATTLGFPANAGGATYQLVLTRDATMPTSLGGAAPQDEASSALRTNVPSAVKRIAGPPAPAQAAGGRRQPPPGEALADKAAAGATVSGHASAESPAATRVLVEITVPRR